MKHLLACDPRMLPDPRFLLFLIFILIQSTIDCEESPNSELPKNETSKRKPPEAGKITSGFPAAPNSYPYITAVTQPPEDLPPGHLNLYGAGIILGNVWILTAKSLLFNPGQLLAGPRKVAIYPKYNTNLRTMVRNKAKFFRPAKIFCAPSTVSDVTSLQSDIALVKLAEPIPLGLPPHNFRHIKIVSGTEWFQKARIAGWGRSDIREPASSGNDLLEAEIKLPPWTYCMPSCKIITRLKAPYMGYPNSCFGDEGGPVVIKNPRSFEDELVGMIVFQDPSCEVKSIFVNVTTYLPWIKRVMETESAKFEC